MRKNIRLTLIAVVVIALALWVVVPVVSATTNLLPYSQQFSNSAYNNRSELVLSVSKNIAPDDTFTAFSLNATPVNGNHYQQFPMVIYTSGNLYTISIYAKSSAYTNSVQLTFPGAQFGYSQYANYNITSCSVLFSTGGNATVTNESNGYCRIGWSAKATSTSGAGGGLLFLTNNTNATRAPVFIGDINDKVGVWGAQLEINTTPGQYTSTNETILSSFSATPTSGNKLVSVLFNDTSTANVNSWEWIFTDKTGNDTPILFESTKNATHAFGPGNYLIQLNASNNFGSGIIPNLSLQTTFINVTDFDYSRPMGKLINADTNLTISTYDGSGQALHNCVIDNVTPWNGYRYLMVMSVYPFESDAYENPAMRYSNDKINWYQIGDQPDPIIPAPASGFNSDPNIAIVGNELYLFSRYADSYTPSQLWYNVTTTTDGVLWSSERTLSIPRWTRSNSWYYNGAYWEMWGHNLSTSQLEYYAGDVNGLNYTYVSATTGITPTLWHSEVKKYNGLYQLLGVDSSDANLYYYNSTDGITWTPSESNPVLSNRSSDQWDFHLYKSSFVESGGVFDVWYSGINGSSATHIGYTSWGYSPLAMFAPAGPLTIYPPNGQAFTDTSTGFPTSWGWQFNEYAGNNTWITFNTSQNATFFGGVGVYGIRLNASTSSAFNISTQSTTVTVVPPGVPVASFTANVTSGRIPLAVQFTDTSTNNPTSWAWVFTGNGDIAQSILQSPVVVFSNPGVYSVNLTATNANGTTYLLRQNYINVVKYASQSVSCPNSSIIGAFTMLGLALMIVGGIIMLMTFLTSTPFVINKNAESISARTKDQSMYFFGGIAIIICGSILLVLGIVILSPIIGVTGC